MSLLTIVIVTYKQATNHLPLILHSLCLQTNKDFDVLVMHDGSSQDPDEATALSALLTWKVCEQFKEQLNIKFYESPERFNDYGHSNRAKALDLVETKYLNWNNGDNYLTPVFVQVFMDAMEAGNLDFCWSDILHNYADVNGDGRGPYHVLNSQPCLNRIDIANFMIKTDWARKVGFNHRGTGADGLFVQELVTWYGKEIRAQKLDIIPLVHN